jgi:hypothetical protein
MFVYILSRIFDISLSLYMRGYYIFNNNIYCALNSLSSGHITYSDFGEEKI